MMSVFVIVAFAVVVPTAVVYIITELDARWNKAFLDEMENPWKKR